MAILAQYADINYFQRSYLYRSPQIDSKNSPASPQKRRARQNDLDIFTRIIHLGLVIFGLLAWGTGEWADDYKKLKHIGFYVHSWIGMGVSFFVSLRLIYGIIGPRKARFAQWVPYTRDRLQFVWEVTTMIYFQALRLLLKKTPFFTHPKKRSLPNRGNDP